MGPLAASSQQPGRQMLVTSKVEEVRPSTWLASSFVLVSWFDLAMPACNNNSQRRREGIRRDFLFSCWRAPVSPQVRGGFMTTTMKMPWRLCRYAVYRTEAFLFDVCHSVWFVADQGHWFSIFITQFVRSSLRDLDRKSIWMRELNFEQDSNGFL